MSDQRDRKPRRGPAKGRDGNKRGAASEKGGGSGARRGGFDKRRDGAGGGGSDKRRGGPDRGRSGPDRGRGGPDRERGGPDRGRGGPDRERGGPDRGRGGPDRERGGPDKRRGGPDRERGGPDKRRGGPDRERGGSDRGRGGSDRGRGGPDRERGGSDRGRGGSDRGRGGPDRERGGSDRGRGGPDRGRGGPGGPGGGSRKPQHKYRPPTGIDRVVTPTRWMGRGEAIVEGSGKPLVVWGGIPGEAGLVKIHHRGNNQDRARWLSAEQPDPARRSPPCDKYDRCGGCPLMHLEPEAQDDARLSMVADLFAARGLTVDIPKSVIACPDGDENYRHVVKMACGRSDWGRPRLGAYERDSHKVLPIPNCRVSTSALRRAMGTITHQILESGVPPYEAEEERGVLRHVLIRESRLTGEMLVTLVCARRPRDAPDLADAIMQNLSLVVGVHMHINSDPSNAIFNAEEGAIRTVTLTGRPTIDDEIAGVRLRFGPTDFFQVNPSTAELIVNDVMDLTADLADRPVVDLYCGVGTFSLPMAKRHPWVGGIEYSAGAVERAKANAQLLKLKAEFIAGPVAEKVPQWASRVSDSAPVVVLDPARRGLEEEAFDPIESLNPARMLYVSCNPAALARDLAEWTKRGWTVDEVRAYDMFPQTAHLEMLAVLSPPVAPVAKSGGPRRRIVR